MKKKILRFIENKYDLKSIDISNSIKQINRQIEICEKNATINYPPNMKKSIDSLGKKKTKTTFYTGTGGNIYIYWKQYLFHDKSKEFLEKFHQSLMTNLLIVNKEDNEKDSNCFFMGDSGIYLFYCVYAIEINDKKTFDENFNNLLNLKSISEKETAEVELLYGTSGYLYSLLFLKKYLLSQNKNNIIDKNGMDKLNKTIIDIFHILLINGIKSMDKFGWKKSLLYPFPMNGRKTPKFYLRV